MSNDFQITAKIADLVAEADLGDAREELFARALDGLVDTVGVTVAARPEPGVAALVEALRRERADGESTLFVGGENASEGYAALVNGMAGHALDYDDVADAIYGHPSAVMFPALVAVAETEGASGADLLDAYVIGFQVVCSIGAGLPIRRHYSKGWHATATIGVIGATAGLARLLGLEPRQTRRAIGIAASMAAGSRQNFGTMTKPLHPGLAGRGAINAARLAEAGFTADEGQLEAPLGFFSMFGEGSDLALVGSELDKRWLLTDLGLNVKKYPCCYNTHRTADAALELAAEGGAPSGEAKITLTVEPGGLDPLIHSRPRTGLEGKFSAEYVVAAGLHDGRVGLATFTDQHVQTPELQALLRQVTVVEAEHPPFGGEGYEFAFATIEIDEAGEVRRNRVDVPKGDARAPLSRAELDAKFRECVSHGAPDADADALLAELREIPVMERVSGFAALRGLAAPAPLTVGGGDLG